MRVANHWCLSHRSCQFSSLVFTSRSACDVLRLDECLLPNFVLYQIAREHDHSDDDYKGDQSLLHSSYCLLSLQRSFSHSHIVSVSVPCVVNVANFLSVCTIRISCAFQVIINLLFEILIEECRLWQCVYAGILRTRDLQELVST